MKILKSFIKALWSLFLFGFLIYSIVLRIQGKSIKEEIFSWFDNTVTLASVMEDNNMTREEAFSYIIDTTAPRDLPGILEDMTDHVFLNARSAGISSKLKNDVRVTVVFTGLLSAPWTSEEILAAQTELETMNDQIMAEAASHGVTLNLSLEYHTASVFYSQAPAKYNDAFVEDILSSAGLPPAESASRDLEQEYDVDEAPIVFCFNYHDRSHAQSQYNNGQTEYAFLFKDTNGYTSYAHELYHLFGAKDFYYPADVKALADQYFPNSVMLNSEGSTVDDLTAYLIGWTDEPSASALSFLKDTAYLTSDYMDEQHELETLTGYVEDYDDGESTYTGYLDFGVPHGQGTKIWNDGRRYEGEWNNGQFHGEGTYTWADGRTYTGSFVNSLLEGYGTFTWTDGSTYTGEWVNGQQHGSGTMYHVDSGTYTGDFVEGQRMGEGTYTWTNGDSYTGEWVDGTRTGYGTYTWADGSTASGYWEAGELIE